MRVPAQSASAGYAAVLRRIGSSRALAEGKRVHREIVENGWFASLVLKNLVVQMYGKCGSVQDARLAFDGIGRDKNVFSWSIMIAAYVQNRRFSEAVDLYEAMEEEGMCKPEAFVFSQVLGACSSLRNLDVGKRVHARIVERKLEMNVVVETALLKMYADCGCIEESRQVFGKLQQRDVVAWNAMLAAFAQNGHYKEALSLYHRMCLDGFSKPNHVTLASLLSACCVLSEGKKILLQAEALGLESNVILQTSLLSLYTRCSALEDAKQLFDRMKGSRNLVAWNTMIAAYAQGGHPKKALELYEQLDLEPDCFTFSSVLGACFDLQVGRSIHDRVVSCGLKSVVVDTALVSMYARCGSLKEAQTVFENLSERDTVAWNTMISCYAQLGHIEQALALYDRMIETAGGSKPTAVTFTTLLGAIEDIDQGKLLHSHAIASNLDRNQLVETALVNMYAKCGSLEEARSLFDRMPNRDVSSWNVMISAYSQSGDGKEALWLYQKMSLEGTIPDAYTFVSMFSACCDLQTGKLLRERLTACSHIRPDVFVQNALVSMYSRCGSLEDAKSVFDATAEQAKDVITWNSMISAYVQHGHNKEALEVYHRMNLEPDDATFLSVVGAVSGLVDQVEAEQIQSRVYCSRFKTFPAVETALLNMNAKLGNVEAARAIFENMQVRDTVSWNTMVAACAEHGDGREALHLLHKMQLDGLQPSEATFTSLLASCVRKGLVEEGLALFNSQEDHGLKPVPEHYRCVVDLLARSGRLEEAQQVIDAMPVEDHDSAAWMTLGAACKIHGNVGLARRCAELLDPDDAASYVLLSNIYSGG